jgi:SAM-dependent methyltransferase
MPVPSETLHAFDLHARGYVASWGSDPLAQWMRARVLALCAKFFPASSRVLDLGCGPGLDAAALTALGYRVTAIDASSGMVAEARTRSPDARIGDLDRLDLPDEPYDGALSNFGAINCLSRLDGFGRGLAGALKPGAYAVLVIINRWCPAEDLALAVRARRPRRRGTVVSLEGRAVPVRYLTGRDLRNIPGFTFVHQEALGAFVAPPDLGGALGRRARLEPWVAAFPGVRDLGDHTLVVLRRRNNAS